jgi:hypothetical protein
MNEDMAELLAAEAEEAERHADPEDHGPSYRRKYPPRDPAQVYSLRIPVAQLEELRQLAAGMGVTPSALMRQWVLERMAAEKAGLPDALQVWERLREVLGNLEDAHRRLAQSAEPQRWAGAAAARTTVLPVSLDPQDVEHKEIRTLITDRVVERMEEEIAEWKQERASGASS